MRSKVIGIPHGDDSKSSLLRDDLGLQRGIL